jgi:hypothetical protein
MGWKKEVDVTSGFCAQGISLDYTKESPMAMAEAQGVQSSSVCTSVPVL